MFGGIQGNILYNGSIYREAQKRTMETFNNRNHAVFAQHFNLRDLSEKNDEGNQVTHILLGEKTEYRLPKKPISVSTAGPLSVSGPTS